MTQSMKFALGFISGLFLSFSAYAGTMQYQDWQLICEGPNGTACLMAQMVSTVEANQPVLSVAIAVPKEGAGPMIVFNLPPQIDKANDLQIRVDEQEPLSLPIKKCTAEKCSTLANLNDQILSQLKNGSKALVIYSVQKEEEESKRVGVYVSLNGFTAAYNALIEKS